MFQEGVVNMSANSAKYFKALLQIVLSAQTNLFEKMKTRDQLLRSVFESTFYIEGSEFEGDIGWGISDTRYFDNEHDWVFGFLCKVIENPNVITLPAKSNSLLEIENMEDKLVLCTPFYFNFSTQNIYTQSHWQIARSSNSSSEIWRRILTYKLKQYIYDLDVQSIPEEESFWRQLEQLRNIQKAEFSLFGPNILNEERIRDLLDDFQPTGSRGISLLLKNYIDGLRLDSHELMTLLNYVLRGGGKGVLSGLDRNNVQKVVKTESKPLEINVTDKLDKRSNQNLIYDVLKQLQSSGNREK